MAKFRYAVLENDKALGASENKGTIIKDLPERGILSTVQLLWRRSHTWVDNMELPAPKAITKIEVTVDGSTVIKSLDGSQCRALMEYNGGPFTQTNPYTQGQTSNFAYNDFHLYFGRSVSDTKYGLDLSQYANPQLHITYDETATTHNGVTYDVSSSPSIVYNIMAKVMDGTPTGFMNKYVQSRQIGKWTMATSEETNTEIPRGQALRGLMLMCGYKNKAYYDFWDHVKLDFDNGKYVPLDMDYENLVRLQWEAWPKPVIKSQYVALADGDDLDTELYYVNGSGFTVSAANISHIKIPIIYWPISTINNKDSDGSANTGKGAFAYTATGWGPMQTFYIPMRSLLDGDQESISTTAYGRIDLKTTSGASASTSAIGTIVAEYEIPNGQ